MTNAQTQAHDALRPLALLATGRTGADVERLVREVRRQTRREQRGITWSDLEQALLAGQMRMSDDLRWRTAVHEAGHAIAFTLTGIAEVLIATIGIDGVGQVSSRPNNHLAQTESWLMDFIACLLAGRTAELLVFGEPLVGAGGGDDSDLARATSHAAAAETRLGFSKHQPLVYHREGGSVSELNLDRHLADRVNARLLSAEQAAREMLEARHEDLIAIANRLSDIGVMTGDEVRQMLDVRDG
ncbi:ATP-dependent Zn protease [Neorhizobium galegae bv. orientalis]|nr:ATP-dependent Zn protease [Neorhizobium galegae bv. orientalis]